MFRARRACLTGRGDFSPSRRLYAARGQIALQPTRLPLQSSADWRPPFLACGTQTFQSVRPAELHSAAKRQKADRMSAWRTGRRPVLLVLAVPSGAPDPADNAN